MTYPIQNKVRNRRDPSGLWASNAGGEKSAWFNSRDGARPKAPLGSASSVAPTTPAPASLVPAHMPRIGTVDDHYQSFNVEMVEVIGGRFWRPYGEEVDAILHAQLA
ncbi:MAG: hypothetical protein ACRDG4_07545, partial [Chloroflexota bacterium]